MRNRKVISKSPKSNNLTTANIIEGIFCIGVNEAKMETLEEFKTAINGIREKSCRGIAFHFNDKTITFKFLEGEASPEEIQDYNEFVALLNQNAKTLRRAATKSADTSNDKFTFRVITAMVPGIARLLS